MIEEERGYIAELDAAIEEYHRYPDGYEQKYYGNIVALAAIRLRKVQLATG